MIHALFDEEASPIVMITDNSPVRFALLALPQVPHQSTLAIILAVHAKRRRMALVMFCFMEK